METPGPSAVSNREITQDDIDTALREWNGDPDSKRRVRQYMTEHGREKDTADWLRSEYGDDLPAFPVTVEGAAIDLPWPKVQRYLARLVKDNRFFTEEAAPEKAPTVREIFEQYKPVITNLVLADTAYQNACRNSDRETAVIEGDAAVKRAALTITEPDFMRLYFDMSGFRNRLHREIIDETYPVLSQPQQEAEVPDLSGHPVTREGDAVPEFTGAADLPPHDPFAPAYRPGDIVYLNNTAFEITGIGLLDVELRDPALPIPLFRAESKENFERLLHLDHRNSHITCYLAADLHRVNDDFREVLTKHLLTDRDKGYISGWLRSGENNRGIAQRLSLAFASRAETVTLETGDIADYFTSTVSMAVEIQDKFGTKLSLSWEAVAPILRALWLQELDGFSHEPVQRESVELAGQLTYREGDKVAFGYGDHDIAGTIEYIRLWMRC